MTADLHAAFAAEAAANPGIAGVIPVGDAFQLGVDSGKVQSSGFFDANGVFVPPKPGEPMDLWWDDDLHASKYGSYLDALVQFGTITGLDPTSLGADESAAQTFGIAPTDVAVPREPGRRGPRHAAAGARARQPRADGRRPRAGRLDGAPARRDARLARGLAAGLVRPAVVQRLR